MSGTLVLSRNDVARHLPLRALASAIGDAYIRHSTEPLEPRPQRAHARIGDGQSLVVSFPGVLAGYDAYTVKVNAKTDGNPAAGLPFLRGAILLVERETGFLRAILDAGLITAMRTAAAGALGITALARPGAATVALFGAGVQGTWHLGALAAIERLGDVRIYDLEPARAEQLAAELGKSLGVNARAARSPEDAVDGADVIIAVTPSRVAILDEKLVRPGMHVSAFGADEPGKIELGANLCKRAKLVVDDRALALTDGALNVAATTGELDAGVIHGELGEVLAGRKPGRERDDEITIFGAVGLAWQDLVAAELCYRRAVDAGAGTFIDF
ncbi:MAG TPA: ornithine cyclodeaminase family protein [Polyangia bacterium]|nr:ornithine cyclodeaminase family protein [Polyangia bacterium]